MAHVRVTHLRIDESLRKSLFWLSASMNENALAGCNDLSSSSIVGEIRVQKGCLRGRDLITKPLFTGIAADTDALIESIEQAWNSGESPSPSDFVDSFALSDENVLPELVYVDLEYRLKFGQKAQVERYFAEYPSLSSNRDSAMNFIATEYEVRSRNEPELSHGDYLDRFPEYSEELVGHLERVRKESEFRTTIIGCAGEETIVVSPAYQTEQEHLPESLPAERIRDYRIVRKIGQGGMGDVYEAVHEKLGKRVAIKLLPPTQERQQESATQFEQEMLAIGKIDHPHVVRATDGGVIDGRQFLVMEYLQSSDLRAILAQRGQLEIEEACDYISQAAAGFVAID